MATPLPLTFPQFLIDLENITKSTCDKNSKGGARKRMVGGACWPANIIKVVNFILNQRNKVGPVISTPLAANSLNACGPMINNWTTTTHSPISTVRITQIKDLPGDMLFSIYDAMKNSGATVADLRNFITSHPTFYDILQKQTEKEPKTNASNALDLFHTHLMATWELAKKQGNGEPPSRLHITCTYRLEPSNALVTLQMILSKNNTSEPTLVLKVNDQEIISPASNIEAFKESMTTAIAAIKRTHPETTKMSAVLSNKLLFKLNYVFVSDKCTGKNKDIFNLLNILIAAANVVDTPNLNAVNANASDKHNNEMRAMMTTIGQYYSPLSKSYVMGNKQILERMQIDVIDYEYRVERSNGTTTKPGVEVKTYSHVRNMPAIYRGLPRILLTGKQGGRKQVLKTNWVSTGIKTLCKDGKQRTIYTQQATNEQRVKKFVVGLDGIKRVKYVKF